GRESRRRCVRPARVQEAPPRSGVPRIRRAPLTLFRELSGGLIERPLDQCAMLFGVDLAAEDTARREDDHARELRSELREGLVMELLRVFAAAFANAVRLDLGLRANIDCRGLGGLGRSLGDRLGLSPGLREEALDLGVELLAIGLRLLGQRETLTDPGGAGPEHGRDWTP